MITIKMMMLMMMMMIAKTHEGNQCTYIYALLKLGRLSLISDFKAILF